jgi:hypothetical protein
VTSPDLDRIRFVTRHFNGLKGGLNLVAVGLVFLSTGAGYNGWGHPAVVFYLRTALTFGSAALMLYSMTYYKKRFGEVLERRKSFPAKRRSPSTVPAPGDGLSTPLRDPAS